MVPIRLLTGPRPFSDCFQVLRNLRPTGSGATIHGNAPDPVRARRENACRLLDEHRRVIVGIEAMENFLVAILGAGKSGTTGLFYAVHAGLENHLQRPVPGLFEPRTVRELDEFSYATGVIKAMLPRLDLVAAHPVFERLTHRVLIYRDPRDNIVSFILWRFGTRLHNASEGARARALKMFARKQSAPIPSVCWSS